MVTQELQGSHYAERVVRTVLGVDRLESVSLIEIDDSDARLRWQIRAER